MMRTAITGLFISAALLASPVFAADDLCAANLQKINDNMTSTTATSEGLDEKMTEHVKEAEAARDRGDTKECIAITSKVLERQNKAEKGGNGS